MNAISPLELSVAPASQSDDARWHALQTRDRAADGQFFYGVITTGVYCRPSCSSRRALRANVRFFDSAAAASAAGFRPCKRCRPIDENLATRRTALIERACRIIETSERTPALAELAASVGLSAWHFHRLFREITGVTPRAYALARRQQRLRTELANGSRVTDAVFEAGFGSTSRFYEKAAGTLGMKATDFRKGGQQTQIRFAVAETSLGSALIAATTRGVCAVDFGDDPDRLVRALQDRFPQAELIGADAAFEKLVAAVLAHIERPGRRVALALDVQGTAFQQRVWQELQKIPLGETASYTDIARRIGQPTATRAVAQACGANRIAVLIPCHRVVRNDASLSGYRWGVERKRALLDKESQK